MNSSSLLSLHCAAGRSSSLVEVKPGQVQSELTKTRTNLSLIRYWFFRNLEKDRMFLHKCVMMSWSSHCCAIVMIFFCSFRVRMKNVGGILGLGSICLLKKIHLAYQKMLYTSIAFSFCLPVSKGRTDFWSKNI